MRNFVAIFAGFLAVGSANAQQSEPTEKYGNFTLRKLVDPMSDASRGILVSNTEDIRLVLKCDNNGPGELYVSLIAKRYLGATRSKIRDVKYRLDSDAPASISAYHDGSSASVIDLKPTSKGGQWLAGMLGAKKLVLEVSNYNYDTYTQVIDMSGFREGVARTAAICRDTNWYSPAT